MKNKIIILIILMMLLIGCSKTSLNNIDDTDVSEKAKIVIDTMLNCPNLDFFNPNMITPMGIGVNLSEEEKEKIKTLSEIIDQNWNNAIGEYFGYGYLKAFLADGTALKFFCDAYFHDKTITVQNINLVEKDEAFEKVLVTLLVNDEEKQVEVKFNYDIEGLIKTIITSDINY